MSYNAKPVAFFDFDGTLTRRDTLLPFLRFIAGRQKFYTKMLALSPVLAAFGLGILPNDIAKQIVLKSFVRGMPLSELFLLGARFSRDVLPGLLRQKGMERLAWHQAQGHDCIIVSASLDIYLADWSQTNGFKAAFTSSLAEQDGIATGLLAGKNCYGDEKKVRIEKWIAEHHPALTFAYGDTRGDLQMLASVQQGWMLKKLLFNSYWKRVV